MFRRLSEPLPLSEASLLLLRPALNTPVVNVGYLPVGPARAAVVAFAEEYGGIGIALGLRSSDSGQLVILRNQESIDFDAPLADALEPLLDAAERMGFLFDEDMLQLEPGPKGRSEAMVHWAVLMGGMDSLLPPPPTRSQSQAESEDGEDGGPLSPSLAVGESQYPELILDDVAPLVLSGPQFVAEPAAEETFDDEPVVVPDSDLDADLSSDLDSDRSADLDADLDSSLGSAFDAGVDEDLDETLEDVLDEALADGFGQGLEDEAADWDLADPLLGDLDLTQPTAPILAPRPTPAPKPTPVQTPPLPLPIAKPPPPPVALLAAPTATPVPPQVLLSKFRHVGADRSAELARIPIVRIRRETEKKVPFLARLLSSF